MQNVEQYNLDELLPQKFPFRMIDRIAAFEKNKSLTAVKNITGNEWVFEKENAESAVFPETLIIEAAAQTALAFYKLSTGDDDPNERFIFGSTKSNFTESAYVGDELVIQTSAHKLMSGKGYVDTLVSVKGKQIAEVTVYYSIQPKGSR